MTQRYKSLVLSRLSTIFAKFGYKYPIATTTFMTGIKEKIITDLEILNKDPNMFPVAIKMLNETMAAGIVGLSQEEIDNLIFATLKEYYPTEFNNISDVVKNINPVIVIK